jgi:hypothetical protein
MVASKTWTLTVVELVPDGQESTLRVNVSLLPTGIDLARGVERRPFAEGLGVGVSFVIVIGILLSLFGAT